MGVGVQIFTITTFLQLVTENEVVRRESWQAVANLKTDTRGMKID